MSKGGGTTTNTSSNSPPPQVLAQYENVIGQANQAASTPYTTGGFNASNLVAGFSPDQTAAFNTIDQSQGIQQPYLAAGQQDLTASQTPLWNGVQQYNPSTMAQYANPYLNQAVGSTEAQMNNMDAQQQQQVIGNAVSSGAWGGDRSAIAQSELANQQSLANNQTISNMENTGFNQQQGEFNTQQTSQLGANEANAWLGSQGAALESGLGSAAQNAALTGANAQESAGALQQTQNQSMLNIPYEQFQAQQAYPFQTTGWLSGVSTGLGGSSGGTSTSTQTQPSSNSLFKRGGFVPKFAAGGFAPSLASGGVGGDVPDPSKTYFSSIGSPSAGSSSGGNGIPKPANIQPQPAPNPIAEMSGIANIGNSGTSIYKSLSGAPASSLSSPSGTAGLANDFGGGSSFANSSLSPSSVPGYLSANALDSNPGMGASAMDSLSADGSSIIPAASSSSGFFSGLGDAFMSMFSKGGKVPHRAFGGNLLPDVVSGIGDVVGAFFGDPMAGSQATGILSQVDGGQTKPGLQLSSLARGGVTKGFTPRHYDDGGGIGLPTPQQTGASPTAVNVANQFQNMTVEQLQQLNARSMGRNPQIQMALQRKQMTGGAAQQPQQAGIAPMAAQAQGAAPPAQAAAVPSGAQPENIMQQNGFARGGFTPQKLATGGGSGAAAPSGGGQPTINPFGPGSGGVTSHDLGLLVDMLGGGTSYENGNGWNGAMIPASQQDASGNLISSSGLPPSPFSVVSPPKMRAGGFTPQKLATAGTVNDVYPEDAGGSPDQYSKDLASLNATLGPQAGISPAANTNMPPPANDNQGFMPQQATGTTGMAPLPSHDDFMKNYNSEVMNAAPYNQVNPWISLATGVLGAAAGNSPHISQNLARGAMEGLQNYGGQQKEAAAESEHRGTLQEQGEGMYQNMVEARAKMSQEQAKIDQDAPLKAAQANYYNSGAGAGNHPVAVMIDGKPQLVPAKEAMQNGYSPVQGFSATQATLSPQSIDQLADAVHNGVPAASLGLGMGMNGDKKAVLDRLAEKYPDADIAGARISFAGNTSGARTVSNMSGKIEYASDSLASMIPLARSASANLDRTQFPSVNAIQNAVEKGTGGDDIVALNTYLNAVIADQSSLFVRGGLSTDAARAKATENANAALSKGQLNTYFDSVQKEIAAQGTAGKAALSHFTSQGKDGQGAQPAPAPAISLPPKEKLDTATVYQTARGPAKWNGTTFVPVAAP